MREMNDMEAICFVLCFLAACALLFGIAYLGTMENISRHEHKQQEARP
jgi:hypothetical protein